MAANKNSIVTSCWAIGTKLTCTPINMRCIKSSNTLLPCNRTVPSRSQSDIELRHGEEVLGHPDKRATQQIGPDSAYEVPTPIAESTPEQVYSLSRVKAAVSTARYSASATAQVVPSRQEVQKAAKDIVLIPIFPVRFGVCSPACS